MGDVIIDRHIRAVFTRRGHQRIVNRQRGQTISDARLIDKDDDLILVATVIDRVAAEPGGSRGIGRSWSTGIGRRRCDSRGEAWSWSLRNRRTEVRAGSKTGRRGEGGCRGGSDRGRGCGGKGVGNCGCLGWCI